MKNLEILSQKIWLLLKIRATRAFSLNLLALSHNQYELQQNFQSDIKYDRSTCHRAASIDQIFLTLLETRSGYDDIFKHEVTVFVFMCRI